MSFDNPLCVAIQSACRPSMMAGLFLAVGFASACSEQPSSEGSDQDPPDETRTLQLLRSGDGQACNSAATKATVRSIVERAWPVPYQWDEDERQDAIDAMELEVSEIVAVSKDPTIPAMSCEANLVASEGSRSLQVMIIYQLSEQLDDHGLIVNVSDTRDTSQLLWRVSQGYYSDVILPARRTVSDQIITPVCARFRRGRGQLSFEQIQSLQTEMYSRSDDRLDSSGPLEQACVSEMEAAKREALQLLHAASATPSVSAETSSNAALISPTGRPPAVAMPRGVDRVEYRGPPVIVPGPPPPAPLAAGLSVVSDPSWSRPPLPEFPERARARGIQRGTVALNCAVQPNGSLIDCAVTSEAPTGAGFAQAALAASMRARVSRSVVDRLSAGGRTIFAVQMRDNAETQ